ncbi:MAG: DNA polymerase III subunit alpha [Nitrospirae bacterium]|nr:DNA polymerase III subunit alpha [Nitrospirota bacterium]
MTGLGSFVHLQVHSGYSLLRGVNLVEEIVFSARERGYKALALTDVNNLYACVRFWDLAKQAGLHPILGAKVCHASGNAVLLVESKAGYARLCEILSAVHQIPGFDLVEALREDAGGLVILSKNPRLLEALRVVVPPSHLFGLVTPGCGPTPYPDHSSTRRPGAGPHKVPITVPEGGCSEAERATWIRRLEAMRLRPVATTETTFLDPGEHWIHKILRAIDLNTSLSRMAGADIAPETAWLTPPDEIGKVFRAVPAAIENSLEIAERCVLDSPPWGETIFPSFDGLSGTDTFALLERSCLEVVDSRYPGRPPEVLARLRRELEIIRDKGFAGYFLIVRDIVRRATRSCGRGSGAASLVSYLLGITAVDPIRHNLFFERFLNPSRKDPPDIDVDFAWDERDNILSYVFEKYGAAHSAMVANHVTFQPRMAVREVAKVYGLADDEIGAVTERIGGVFESTGMPTEAVRGARDLGLKEPWPEILKIADRLVGLPRHLSVHPGGVILTPGPITRHVPIQTARKEVPCREGFHRTSVLHPPGSRKPWSMPRPPGRGDISWPHSLRGMGLQLASQCQAESQKVAIIHWEKDQAEDAGLVKIDLLGNRSLAVIRDATQMVREKDGVPTEFLRTNPIDDPGAQELMRTGRTMGCFYVESPAMRLLLKRCRKPDYDHLVIASSIIRPAANDYIMEYIARVRGEKPATPIHPLLEPVLSDSYQIAVYQEHVMLISMAFAGFSIVEADGLRKALGKKDYFVRLGQFRDKFFAGARAKGIAEQQILEVWKMIESFSGYSFCKPHSASYAMVSYQSAFIKAHHPAEFYAAVISNQGGYYHWWAYHNDAIREGLRVLPPSINLSEWKWRGWERTLRMGFMQIKGLKKESVDVLVEDRRRGGPYGSLREFLDRVRIDPSDTILLIKAGAFDRVSVSVTRAQMIWSVLSDGNRDARTNGNLFPSAERLPALSAYDEQTMLRHEADVLGFLVSRHPLTLYQDEIRRLNAIPAKDLDRYAGKDVTLVGWWVTSKPAETKRGERMEFVSFEDTTALFDATLFPKVYARAVPYRHRPVPYVIRGKVEEQFGACTVTVSSIAPLSPIRSGASRRSGSRRGLPDASPEENSYLAG